MSTKLIIFAAAIIVAGPVLAAGAASSGGSSSTSASSTGGHSSGGGGSGGGHDGSAGGGGGHFGGSGMGGRGAAASAHGAAFGGAFANHEHANLHSNAVHGARPIAGQHVSLQPSTTKMASTDRHHHPHFFHRREPNGNDIAVCTHDQDPFLNPWNNCFGPTKSTPGKGTNRRS